MENTHPGRPIFRRQSWHGANDARFDTTSSTRTLKYRKSWEGQYNDKLRDEDDETRSKRRAKARLGAAEKGSRHLRDPEPSDTTEDNGTNNDPYIYGPFNTAAGETRLLHLLPGSWDDPLRCELEPVQLARAPSYQALSYVWGDSAVTKTILLHNKPFQVTVNLWLALRRLRKAQEKRTMWIDAICINQNDLDERSSQVSNMGQIFSGAEEVIAWLGDSLSGTDTGLAPFLGTVEDRRSIHLDANTAEMYCTSPIFTQESETLAAVSFLHLVTLGSGWIEQHLITLNRDGQYQVSEKFERSLEAAMKMTGLPYWSRMWVFQEIVLAQKISIILGALAISWDIFVDVIRCWVDFSYILNQDVYDQLTVLLTPLSNFTSPRTYYTLRCQDDQFKRHLFWQTLWLLRWQETTDPRDRVYGLLGLFGNSTQKLMNADYSLTASEAITRCTVAMIKADGNLRALMGPRRCQQPGVPSWIPDLTVLGPDTGNNSSPRFLSWILRTVISFSLFRAAGERRFHYSHIVSKLTLKGAKLDVVKETTRPLKFVANETNASWGRRVIEEWGSLVNTREKLEASDFLHIVVGGTMTSSFGGHHSMRRALPADKKCFDYFFNRVGERSSSSSSSETELRDFAFSVNAIVFHRTLFKTSRGHISHTYTPQPGDEVWIFFGGNVPFLLRPYPEDSEHAGCYQLIGDCYVHGIMDGEAMEGLKEEDVKTVTLA